MNGWILGGLLFGTWVFGFVTGRHSMLMSQIGAAIEFAKKNFKDAVKDAKLKEKAKNVLDDDKRGFA